MEGLGSLPRASQRTPQVTSFNITKPHSMLGSMMIQKQIRHNHRSFQEEGTEDLHQPDLPQAGTPGLQRGLACSRRYVRGPSQPWAPLGEIQCPKAGELRP